MTTIDGLLHAPGLAPVWDALPGARLVGGCVRDALVGRQVADIDIATPWTPDRVMAALGAAGLRVIPTGLHHGTVTAMSAGAPFEVTTLRRDEEADGRHARVAWTADWREDAARRDFTFNAMSLDRDGTVHDPFGGAADLQAGRVRFVGDPAARLAEDRLRVLRYFRFLARFGTTPPDAATLDAIRGAVPHLARLSAERVWSELKRLLTGPAPDRALDLMAATGVLDAVLPGGGDVASFKVRLDCGLPVDAVLRLAALMRGDPETVAARLRLSNAEADRLAALRRPPVPGPEASEAALRAMLETEPAEWLAGRAWLADPASAPALCARLAALAPPRFPLAGRDVLALGVPPGPAVGEALERVRLWWRAGGYAADAEACRAELARMLRG